MTANGASVLADAAARDRIENDLDTTFFVEAAAGTGKTTALVRRIMAVLMSGKGSLKEMVALTFTEKAAGELKLRLRAQIEDARAAQPDAGTAQILEEALAQLEEARIGTIHGFCADILRERPVEAGVDPLFEVASQDVADRLLDEAFADWFESVLESPGEGVSRLLRRAAWTRTSPRGDLRMAAGRLVDHRDFPAAWRREPVDRAALLDGLFDQLASVAELARAATKDSDYLARNLREIDAWVGEIRRLEEFRGRDYDRLEAALHPMASWRSWNWKGYGRDLGPGLARDAVIAQRDAVRAELERVKKALEADLAPLLQAELAGVVREYEGAKERAGRLDFLDLLIRARDMVAGNAAVRADLQNSYTHFFVDELQDTDPLQLDLLLLLTADGPEVFNPAEARPRPGKLFVVGDPKQSIYRFRRADVAEYERVKTRLVDSGAVELQLTTSFRSVPGIQNAVNRAFETVMHADAELGKAGYVALDPYRPPVGDRPEVIALPVPDPYSESGKVTGFAVDNSYPEAVGAFVDWLVNHSGWTLRETGDVSAIAPRHVCILFRRFQSYGRDVTRPYVEALENRGFKHVLVGGRSLHDREEIFAVRNALAAIEWPDDALRVYGTLRGPLFAFDDGVLLAYRAQTGNLHPARTPPPGEVDADLDEVASALRLLVRLHRRRNRRPIADTLAEFLGAVRAHAGIAVWPRGEQALANVQRVGDLARRFEARGATSFRAFVEQLEAEAESVGAEEAPIVEEGTDGVRLMNVHKAKGLEFPVVILADPTAPHTFRMPSQHVEPAAGLWAESLCGCAPVDLTDFAELELERDAAEANRIAYVAATRARDLLVVPAVGDEELPGWLEVLNPVVYPPAETRRSPSPAAGCPAFGSDSVRSRPPEAHASPNSSVAPGLHVSRAGTHVVWWSPDALKLDAPPIVGVGQEDILMADEGGLAVRQGEDAHRAWQAARSEARLRGAVPSLTTWTIGLLSDLPTPAPAGDMAPVVVLEPDMPRAARPGGRRFGRLVHLALASVDLKAGEGAVEQAVRVHGRAIGASAAEIATATSVVVHALAHPLLAEAAASPDVRREVPVVLDIATLQGGEVGLAEGVVDLAFRTKDGWTVVDFKTDAEVALRQDAYRRQVGLYAAAVAAATGEQVRSFLLVV